MNGNSKISKKYHLLLKALQNTYHVQLNFLDIFGYYNRGYWGNVVKNTHIREWLSKLQIILEVIHKRFEKYLEKTENQFQERNAWCQIFVIDDFINNLYLNNI